jgi:histidine triad (HIT) family protein
MECECVFCEIIRGNSPSTKVYEDEHVLAFLDKNPVTQNHTLIVPKKHYADLYDIPENELKSLLVAAKRITLQYKVEYGFNGANILHASGADAQQSVMHFHLHLVPRRQGDGLDHFLLPACLSSEGE